MPWHLRRALPADADALSLVASTTFLEAFAGVLAVGDIVSHCNAKNNASLFAEWVSDPASIVAIVDHQTGAAPLGYTVLTTPDLPVDALAGDVELRRIYAMTAWLGSGLGPALMARALLDAAALGGERLMLGVYAENRRARRFYERQGFSVIGERQFQVGEHWCDDLIYARAL